jgi:molecular chaperone DnaK (HSP70)
MAASFGIHIGNTSVCLAVSRDGKTDVVAAPTGDRVTPAIVAFTDDEVLVGLAAKQGRLRNMANTVTDNKKMLVGGGGDEGVGSAVNVIEENGQHFYCVDFKEQETRVSPAEILGHLLTYLHSIAETHCKEVSEAHTVLSVPLDWSQEERSLVGNAATKVGFRVVQLISAPAAACLAYGLGQLEPGEREIALVYRVGGVSTDLALVLVAGGCFSILESVSMDGLGGHQLTEVLTTFLGREFKQKYKEDILQSKKGRAKLANQAETVKHVLSTLDTAHCYVESLYDGMDFSSNVTRARFDNQLSPVLTELMAPVSVLLTRAGLTPEDVDSVVMVGGSTKVVKLQNALANAFPDAEVFTNIPGDEVLAYGAAVHASLLTKEGTTEPNVSMMSISKDISARVVGLGGEDDEVEVVCADTPLPVKKSVALAVTGDSTSVEVLWGEDVLDTLVLATNAATKLFLALHLHRDGTATVTLQDKTTGSASTLTLS